jgi:hypothetical protein
LPLALLWTIGRERHAVNVTVAPASRGEANIGDPSRLHGDIALF